MENLLRLLFLTSALALSLLFYEIELQSLLLVDKNSTAPHYKKVIDVFSIFGGLTSTSVGSTFQANTDDLKAGFFPGGSSVCGGVALLLLFLVILCLNVFHTISPS